MLTGTLFALSVIKQYVNVSDDVKYDFMVKKIEDSDINNSDMVWMKCLQQTWITLSMTWKPNW